MRSAPSNLRGNGDGEAVVWAPALAVVASRAIPGTTRVGYGEPPQVGTPPGGHWKLALVPIQESLAGQP